MKRNSNIRSIRFFIVATLVLWLIACLPLSVLISWITGQQVVKAGAFGAVFAVPLALWMWFSVQSANLVFKWPALQLIGWTTVLISILIACLPLHLIFTGQTTGLICLLLWICVGTGSVFAANKIHNKHLDHH